MDLIRRLMVLLKKTFRGAEYLDVIEDIISLLRPMEGEVPSSVLDALYELRDQLEKAAQTQEGIDDISESVQTLLTAAINDETVTQATRNTLDNLVKELNGM